MLGRRGLQKKKLPLTPARTCSWRYSSPSTRLRVLPFDQPSRFWSSVWLRFAHARLIASVVLWPRGFTPLSLRTGRLVFDRYGFVSLLPALSRPSSCGPVALLPCPSVLTVSFFVRRCGFVSLLPALSRPSSCGPVVFLHCPSVPAVSFLFVGVASFRSCPPYRVRRPVAPWPYYLVPPY